MPGLPQSRSASATPLRRMEQLRWLLAREYPARLSPESLRELRREDLRDYRSILGEVRGYARQRMRAYQEGMAARQAWDLDELVSLHWSVQKALWKLRLAPLAPAGWGASLVESAATDFRQVATV
ncbi:MAG: hypothetical protein K2X03_14215 [Bryobacteraceae bacterium]|nr:hypothetical protein [Bryobacteraceae bacterium]